MLKALLWKEWRLQRRVVVAGFALSLLLPVLVFGVALATDSRVYRAEFAQTVAFLAAALLWPLFAAVTAATAYAEGGDPASLGFLLSRPVSRSRVWGVKTAAAAIALLAIVGFSFGVAQFVYLGSLSQSLPFPFPADAMSTGLPGTALQILALAFVLLVFTGATLCSLLTRQALLAVLGGFAVAMSIEYSCLAFGMALAHATRPLSGIEPFLVGFLTVAVLALLAAAFSLFVTGSDLRGVRLNRRVALTIAGLPFALMLGATGTAAITTRVDPSSAEGMGVAEMIPGRSAGLVWVSSGPFAGSGYWLVGPRHRLRRVTPRMAGNATPTPDGEWIVYQTRLGALGLRRVDGCALRRVRFDGSDDQLIHETPCGRGAPVLSDDGSWLTLNLNAGRLLVVSLEAPMVTHFLEGVAGERATAVRWIDGDRRIVVAGRRALYAVDVASGGVSKILTDDGIRRLTVRAASATHLFLRLQWRQPATATASDDAVAVERVSRESHVLLDLSTGAVEELNSECVESSVAASFADDGGTLLYTPCPNDYASPNSLRARDTVSGADRELASLHGRIASIWPSPDAERVLVSLYSGDERASWTESRLVVIDRFGEASEIPGTRRRSGERAASRPAWRFAGWFDADTLALERGGSGGASEGRYQLAYFERGAAEPVLLFDQGER